MRAPAFLEITVTGPMIQAMTLAMTLGGVRHPSPPHWGDALWTEPPFGPSLET
jgi:hypothetical protein